MEVRVQLKICEGCGCLWYRAQNLETVYCRSCQTRLRSFPTPTARLRRGRPPRASIARIHAVAETAGGAI